MAVARQKRNLCVRSPSVVHDSSTMKSRCKSVPPIDGLPEAKKLAYRLVARAKLTPGSEITLTTRRGATYTFVQTHGRTDCHVGWHRYGRKC